MPVMKDRVFRSGLKLRFLTVRIIAAMKYGTSCSIKLCVVGALSLSACNYNRPLTAKQPTEVADEQKRVEPQYQETSDQSEDDVISSIFYDKPQMLQAWQRFSEDGKYRLARPEDFNFSQAAKERLSKYDSMWFKRTKYPYIFGDIARANSSTDLALIVVDTSKHTLDRFRIVIFNTTGPNTIPTSHWLLRGHDLSTSILGWAGNWPSLSRYNEDGSVESFFINWDKQHRVYNIDKEQKGPGGRKGKLP